MIKRKRIQRLPFLAGVALTSVIVSAAGAKATTIDFNYTGSIVSFTAPVTGVYDIDAFGAQGGVNAGIGGARSPGLGAEASGQFSLTAGQTLSILVGGRGGNGSGVDGGGGGGGGSFVAIANMPSVGPACPTLFITCPDTLLVAAGGGGGAGTLFGGVDGQSGTSGTGANIIGGAAGGPSRPADSGLNGGGGGSGYLINAFGCEFGAGCSKSFFNGGAGGAGEDFSLFGFTISAGGDGGFGGGGGGHAGAGGGGGGFSGGAGADQGSGGGGGGSFVNDALLFSTMSEVLLGGVRSGGGEVILTSSRPPCPSRPASPCWALVSSRSPLSAAGGTRPELRLSEILTLG
jgi:hypothetical protein